MADFFENVGKTITKPVGSLWKGAFEGLAPRYVEQTKQRREAGGRAWSDRLLTIARLPGATPELQRAAVNLLMEEPEFAQLKPLLGGDDPFFTSNRLTQKAQDYKSYLGFLTGATGEPDEEDKELYNKLKDAYKNTMRQILKLERAEGKGISTTRTAPSGNKGFQFGDDLGAGFGLPQMKGGMPTTKGGAFGGLGAEVPEEKPAVPEVGPPTFGQTKRPGFLGRKESEFPAGLRTLPPLKDVTKTPRTLEEFDSLFPAPKTNYERPAYLKLRSIWLDLPEEIQDKIKAALHKVGYAAVINTDDLKPYLEGKE